MLHTKEIKLLSVEMKLRSDEVILHSTEAKLHSKEVKLQLNLHREKTMLRNEVLEFKLHRGGGHIATYLDSAVLTL